VVEVTDSIVVAVPVEAVFQYVADYTHALEWMDGMSEFAPIGSSRYGLGARVRAVGRMLGAPVAMTLEVVEFVENERLVSVSEGLVRSVSTWSFEAADGGTRVTFRGEYRLSGLLMVPFADSILKREVAGHISRSLRNLKERLEAKSGEE
jgi:uncharacterized membrane protein